MRGIAAALVHIALLFVLTAPSSAQVYMIKRQLPDGSYTVGNAFAVKSCRHASLLATVYHAVKETGNLWITDGERYVPVKRFAKLPQADFAAVVADVPLPTIPIAEDGVAVRAEGWYRGRYVSVPLVEIERARWYRDGQSGWMLRTCVWRLGAALGISGAPVLDQNGRALGCISAASIRGEMTFAPVWGRGVYSWLQGLG